ncbi:MAG TPA: helix-turn-helix domain-containing protein [Trebonia sp.]|nr:helix-turn-helix domain-containing protein [Trebonia sp.]
MAMPASSDDTGDDTAGLAAPLRERPGRERSRRKRAGQRLSADERRADLLEAAVIEFAISGYHGTRTADIAARAGVSQPYVYALFPDKRALFLACHDWTTQRIKETLRLASADGGGTEDAEEALGRAYRMLLDRRPHQVLFQVQAHAAATADPVIREPVRQRFMELIELSERLHDAPREVVLRHVGRVMLGNVAVALDLPPEFRPAV